ncbi:MAG: hypothetical protein BWK78_00135 [Thiotrichaceae bacterium IS1]|nr:MAG: hypothetical protein BWK78_00135 [Thiotrichaceae bacterium IS1]
MITINPFLHGNPVPPAKLTDRDDEVRTIAGRISTGQSTAITGPLRSGKTSLLHYLSASETQSELYGKDATQLIFSALDGYALSSQLNLAQFWEYALKPLQERMNTQPSLSTLLEETYQNCQQSKFENYEIEKLFDKLTQAKIHLVLMIDNIDGLLHHPHLNTPEFWGGMRALVFRSQGALVIIVTANISLNQLTEGTQSSEFSLPYFNFLYEIVLGPLPEVEVDKLLQQGNTYFTEDDYRFLKELAGGYPYLLQLTASTLWEMYAKGAEKDPIKRYQWALQEVYSKIANTLLKNTWQTWSDKVQEAFLTVSLTQLKEQKKALTWQPSLAVEEWQFYSQESDKHLPKIARLTFALYELQQLGFIVADNNLPNGWRVVPGIFLYFVMGQLNPGHRDEDEMVALPHLQFQDPEGGDILKDVFRPLSLFLMFMGTFFMERIVYVMLRQVLEFEQSAVENSLSAYLIRFGFALGGAFLGYKLSQFLNASRLKNGTSA